MEYVLVISTINNLEVAKEIAKILIEKKLAACVNIVPQVTSIYKWKNDICEDKEYLMLLKTTKDFSENLKAELINLHPYDVPEVICMDISEGSKEYLEWIKHSIQ